MNKKEILFGLAAAIILAVVLSPFASPWPDGLEKVAEDKGFLAKGEVEPAVSAPIPDYAWPGLKSEEAATRAAGASGTLIVFGVGCAVAALIRRKS
ncbi:MAG: PDGLE domain-containing protein [Candidatus Omnitrophica bacterium]|nr:PDGLE domain-containing protein [Candidatus Omnitrophota bacterium]MBU4140888.1 PDGLE domain-containing protein [Candidatus Omnitrophota bacterium]